MNKNYRNLRFFAIFSVAIMVAISFHPALDPVWKNVRSYYDENYEESSLIASASENTNPIIFGTKPDNNINISKLNNIAQDKGDIDSDNDDLYDSVEKILGTDINNNDSDFDVLTDWDEVMIYETDPLHPDSNNDGVSDYQEVYNISDDIEGDGVSNAWDADNDNDGVTDNHDLSPFSKSKINEHFNIDIDTNGNSSFIDFQIRPKDKNHLTLSMQYWDWPNDDQGLMKDLDDSKEDIFILPYLEMSFQTDFKIISEHSGKCLEVSNKNNSENATIQQHTYTGNANQNWSIRSQPNGYVSIIAAHSGKCLAVNDMGMENDASIVQQNFTGSSNQLWKLQPVSNNSYTIIANHSGKCLEIFNQSMKNNATIHQSEYTGESHQVWSVTDVNDFIPTQEDLVEYGVSVELNKVLVPLTPIWDFGVAPAFNGKMYFPSSTPLQVSTETRLIWKVYGNSDVEKKTLIALNGNFVSANNSGTKLIANKTEANNGETFEWNVLGPDRIALKAHNGKYVTLTTIFENLTESESGIDVLVASANEIGEKETFKIVEKDGDNIGLKASNGKFVSIQNPYDDSYQLAATGNTIGPSETFLSNDLGYSSNPVPLVSYYEDFMITGFSFQESYGSQIGCFYSENMNQTIKAGFVTAYEFLRNKTDLSDLSAVMQSRNVTVNATVKDNFNNQDESVFSLMSEMLPESYQYLSNHSNKTIAPIIIAMKDSFTSLTLDDISNFTIFQDNSISIDVTEKPVITSKLFKMNWYNLTNISMLSMDEVLAESMRWALNLKDPDDENARLDNNSLTWMMGLFNTWNMGEYKITNVDGVDLSFDISEGPEVFEIIQNSFFYVTTTMDIVDIIKGGSREYRFLAFSAKYIGKLLKPLGRALKTGITAGLKALRLNKVALKSLNALKSVGNAIKSSKAAQGIITFFKSAKVMSFLDKLGTALILIDLAITGVIAFYMFWSILFEQGFSDFGAALGAWVVIFSFVYAGVYILLALALPIIGIVLAILDIIFGFFGDLLDLFLSWVTKTKMRSTVDLGFIQGPELLKYDYDNNGFDVGDRIEFLAQMYGTVTRTSDGNWGDVCDSYVRPNLKLSVPEGSNTGGFNNKIATKTDGYSYRNETYDMGIWADPISMSNYPLTLQLTYEYKRYYDECVWFFGWWCDRESDSDTVTNDITTLYFDVMPGNLTAFLTWSEITPLDSDGDGLSNHEELTQASNPWRVDTDVDGLWDKYEIDQGLLPYSSDSDGDGLNDKIELEIGSDNNNTDSDSDGLTDFEEYKGWNVNFTFWDTQITMHVESNLLENDTDKDGLTDVEEYIKGLNPRSNDTDANGILDPDEFIIPYRGIISQIDFNKQGNSIRIKPNSTINTTVSYRIKGINCSHQPSNCSINITIENDTGIILFNKTIFLEKLDPLNITYNCTNFSVNLSNNGSNKEGLYLVKYYTNWECNGIIPQQINKREIIGIIDINISAETNNLWECNDVTGGDEDGDKISNLNENIGWMVNYTTSLGTFTIHVTSDPNLIDTDSDGEWDKWEHNCFENSTNPRDPDTDDDGINDWEEKYIYHTNPLHYDSDGDKLDDQTELRFMSDPWDPDSDNDGLTDWQEFEFDPKSNPNSRDTDSDKLNDLDEFIFNSSLVLPDTDADTLFDKKEWDIGTNPRNPDTDGDGLIDGYELLINTNPLISDTDSDNLTDYDELYWGTNASNPDTDNDSLIDGDELFYGTHPLIKDSDRDRVDDSEDEDTYAPQVDSITLAYDLDEGILEFKKHLEEYTNVNVVSLDQLLSDETLRNSSHIVLIGKLDAGNGTVGNLSRSILDDARENTKAISETRYQFFASESSVWNETQTVVMLSQPYRLDHLIVLNMLKTMWKTVSENSVHIQWPTNRTSFDIEAVDEIGVMLWVNLDSPATPSMRITRYNSTTVPTILSPNNGLNSKMKSAGIYLDINSSDNIQNESGEIIDEAWIVTYYNISDLDKNGDGDAKDVGDINEKALTFYWFNENTGKWVKVTRDLDWVYDCGVDTTNVELYGKQYEGYVWAHVSHFSLYAVAGLPITPPSGGGTPASLGPSLNADASASDKFGFTGMQLIFNASLSSGDKLIYLYQWDFDDGTTGEGKVTTHTYDEPGLYEVVLTVMDDSKNTDTDEIYVSISVGNNPPTKPVISGNISEERNVEYIFSALSTDVDVGDMIRYGWDWNNDNIVDEWSEFTESGNESLINHNFSTRGFYRVKVVVEDTTHARSEWSERFLVFIDIDYQIQADGSILLDNEKDGTWDAKYNPANDELSFFAQEASITVVTLIISFLIIIGLLSILYFRKKKSS